MQSLASIEWVLSTGLLVAVVLLLLAALFYPPFFTWGDRVMDLTRPKGERTAEPDSQTAPSSASSSADGDVSVSAIQRVMERVRETVRKPMCRVLAVVFVVCLAARFFTDARLDRYDLHLWKPFLAGVWSGSVAVLMVLGGVVLWRLAHSDRLR
jgi:hypothetical protein